MDERFIRNEMLWGPGCPGPGLAQAHVLVLGLGGVGSYVVECLARAGIGELTVVDSDVISLSNHNRQLLALNSTVGMPKAQAAAARIRETIPMPSSTPFRAPMMHSIGISAFRKAAGMTISSTPLIWSAARLIWS